MRDSFLKLIEVSIRVIRLLKEGSFEIHPYEDGAYATIMAKKIVQPQKILSEAKGLKVCFYPVDDLIEIRIHENI